MKRETIKITTPVDEHEVELYEYMSGGEYSRTQRLLVADQEVEIGEPEEIKDNVKPKLKGKQFMEFQDTCLETLIVSVNGKKEKALELVDDMRRKDYEFVVEKVMEIVRDEDEVSEPEKKKDSK